MKTVNRYLNVLMVPLFVAALALFAGCGASGPAGSADSGGSTALDRMDGGGDTTAPLTMASPAGGTYESAEVVVSLSCSDDGGSGCASTYYVYNADGAAATPTIPYSGPITLSTTTNCVTLRFYSVDNDGNAEAVKSEIYFLYPAGGGDTTPPALTTHNPADNATGVSISMSISATFDETLSGGSIAVGGVVGSSSITNSTVTFALSADLAYSTTYNVTVSGAVDASGNVASDHAWSFTTESSGVDITPPTVSSTIPVSGATNVAVGTTVHAQFSEILEPATVNTTNFTLSDSGGAVVSGAVFDHADGNIMFTPNSSLANDTTYTATVKTGITDLAGNALASNYSWSFTTESAGGDTTPPTVSSVTPASGGTNVAVGTTVHAQFSEVLDPATVNTSTFTLSDSGGAVAGAVADHADGNIMFTPNSSLASDTSYTATVTTGITDLAGNALVSSYSWSFRTEAGDSTPPTVSSVEPASGATDIAVNSVIHAQFSEALDTATVNTSNFTLSGPGGSVAGAVVDHGAGYIMFTPNADLDNDAVYTATLTTGITDSVGNALASNYNWSFTTIAAASGGFDLPPTQTASQSSYSNNTFGLITASTLQGWKSNWSANRPAGITGKLIIMQVGSGSYVGGTGVDCGTVSSYDAPYNTIAPYEEKRNNGLFSTVSMVADGASADVYLKMFGIDPVNDMVVMAMNSYSSTNFFLHGRLYYMLRYWGMAAENLALLNGSVNSNSGSIDTSGSAPCGHPNNGTWTVQGLPDNTGLQASTGEMLAVARGDYTPTGGAFLWDTRTSGEFNGNAGSTSDESGSTKVAFEGTIRGAKWLEWSTLINTTTGAFNSKATQQSALSGIGYNGTSTIYTWCRTSYRAMASLVVGSVILGHPLKLYDGAWIEWGELTSANGGGLPSGTVYSANSAAATDNRTDNTSNTSATYPTNKVGASATTASQIIIDDKAYKGIAWSSGILVPTGSGQEY